MGDMRVDIAAYDPAWPSRFASERALLAAALAPWLDGEIQHVGSTAVPGLAAKPVIDVMAPVADLAAAREAVPVLAGLGYLLWARDPSQWRLWFLKPSPAHRTHHLLLAEPAHPEFAARVAFRDLLRSDAALRDDYQRLKRRLAALHPDDREAYTAAKTGFVRAALADAGHPRR